LSVWGHLIHSGLQHERGWIFRMTSISTRSTEHKTNRTESTPVSGVASFVALIAICLGFFMVILDTTIVNVALPAIRQQFATNTTGQQWIVDGYTLFFAALLLTAGALSEQLGARRVFLAGLVLFTLASALCGAAPVLWLLQLTRLIQGIGAALLVPGSLTLLSQTFPEAKAQARAIGLWGGMGGIAASVGPVAGGLLVDTLGWRSIFFVNVPVGIIAFALTLRAVPAFVRLRGANGEARRLDLPGQLLGMATLALFTLACIQGNQWSWGSPAILGALAGGVAALCSFLLWERHTSTPMLPLRLFGSPTFSTGNTVGFLINFGFYGQLFIINLYFQQLRGYSALLTGLALLPETGMVLIGAALSGRVAAQVGPRIPMAIGLALGGSGLLALTIAGAETNYLALCVLLLIVGFGMSFTMPAMTVAVMSSAPRERAGIASALLNASRQVGSVLGVAALGAFVGQQASFVSGMRMAMLGAGAAFLIGCALTLRFVRHA